PLLAAELLDLGPVRLVDAHARVVGVADDQLAVAGDAQAARPAVAEVGGGERRADVVAVQVVGLDAGGEVHNPKAVVVVDDGRPRADHVAVEHAPLAPNEVRFGTGPAPGGEAGQAGESQDYGTASHGDSRMRRARSLCVTPAGRTRLIFGRAGAP